MNGTADRPSLRIGRGGAKPHEVAAIVVVLLAKLASRGDSSPGPKTERRRLAPPPPFLPAHSWQSA